MLCAVVEEQQRVACVNPVQHGTVVDDGLHTLYVDGEASLGTYKINACQKPIGIDKLLDLRTQQVGESHQYALNLVTLGELQLTQVVVKFHNLGGFEESCLARSGLVVDEAFDLAAMGVEHGDDEAAVAYGNLGIVGGPPLALGMLQRAAYLDIDLGAFASHLSANGHEVGRCVIVYLAFLVDYLVETAQQVWVQLHAPCQVIQHGVFRTLVGDEELDAERYCL